MAKKTVEKPYNGGTWTSARYWQQVRSFLRRAFRYWKPAMDCKIAARKKYEGKNKKRKWSYQCNHCKEWYMDKNINVDHIVPVGTLRCAEDLIPFLERLTCEEDGFQVLCTSCHLEKTKKEKSKI